MVEAKDFTEAKGLTELGEKALVSPTRARERTREEKIRVIFFQERNLCSMKRSEVVDIKQQATRSEAQMLPVCDVLLASCSDVCQFVKLLGYPSVIPYGTIEVEDATRSEPYSFAKPGGQVLVQYQTPFFGVLFLKLQTAVIYTPGKARETV